MVLRKYDFHWGLLGDVELGRPNLGHTTSVEVYRLMQFALRDVLEKKLGTTETEALFYNAGKLAGEAFFDHFITPTGDIEHYIKQLQEHFKKLGIGILFVEKLDAHSGEMIITISEDLDCSGLPELNYEICTYDEGFVCALLERFTGANYKVSEVDCWCTGDRTCRFTAVRV